MTMSIKNAALDAVDETMIDAEIDSVPTPLPPETQSMTARFLLGASLVLIAFNLRPVFSSASALLPEIRTELGLSSLGASGIGAVSHVCSRMTLFSVNSTLAFWTRLTPSTVLSSPQRSKPDLEDGRARPHA